MMRRAEAAFRTVEPALRVRRLHIDIFYGYEY